MTFFEYLKTILSSEQVKAVQNSYQEALHKSFQVNTLKSNIDLIRQTEHIVCTESAFAKDAFLYSNDISLGNSISHQTGQLYIQEPSASAVVPILSPQPNERILDLCASPGGKSTQIAIAMKNTGLLISNEVNSKRALTLMGNIERMGISNAMVTSLDSNYFKNNFQHYFDRILIDAPCSGEGMFKKYPHEIQKWSYKNVLACAKRQVEIIANVVHCLKDNGVLVYSTCTLNTIENEGVVEQVLKLFPELTLSCIESPLKKTILSNPNVMRIMPYEGGEGQFVAKFIKKRVQKEKSPKAIETKLNQKQLNDLKQMGVNFSYYYIHRDKLYGSYVPFLDMPALRYFVCIADIMKNHIVWHHHLMMSVSPECFLNKVTLNDQQVKTYLKGEVLPIENVKGYCALLYHNVVIGLGKGDGFMIKNKFPKGLRKDIS